jgi:hypothetical protein
MKLSYRLLIVGIRLETVSAPAEDVMADTLTSLAETIRDSEETEQGTEAGADGVGCRKGRVLDIAFEGAPALPPKWTYPPPPHVSVLPFLALSEGLAG